MCVYTCNYTFGGASVFMYVCMDCEYNKNRKWKKDRVVGNRRQKCNECMYSDRPPLLSVSIILFAYTRENKGRDTVLTFDFTYKVC